MSTYVEVAWLHDFEDEPVMLYSKLDDQRRETRKVELFPDGRMDRVSPPRSLGGMTRGLASHHL